MPSAASAQSASSHVMTVRLPDGGVAQIRYTGNVAPQVSVSEGPAPAPAAINLLAPMPQLVEWGFGADSPFAMMDRISAEMDRQAAAMLRQADALAAQARSGQVTEAATRNLPPGSASYSFVSTMTGNGVCTQSVEITSQGNGQAPRVVRHSSGNCSAAAGGGGSVNLPTAVTPPGRPEIIETNAQSPRPYAAPTVPTNQPDVIWTGVKGAKPYAGLVREIPPAQR